MFRKQHPQAGSRPGTLVVKDDAQPTRISAIHIWPDKVVEQKDIAPEDINPDFERDDASELKGTGEKVTWVRVQGLQDIDALQTIAKEFHIHPLVLEDLVNLPQRPKHDVYERHAVVIAQAMVVDADGTERDSQVSMIVSPGYVMTFEQTESELFRPVEERLARPGARLRSYGTAYLAYALFDTMVDSYYPIITQFGERLEQLEDQVLNAPRPAHLTELSDMKRQLLMLRRTCWSQRDTVASVLHDEDRFGLEKIRIFLRDTLDHCIQIVEVLDMYRETLSGLMNFYLSSVGQRTNEIMKTLTIMASIFIPLTFLAGIYGMNFEHMPELGSRWGYPTVWGMMAAIVFGMLYYFRRKGWIGAPDWSSPVAQATQPETATTVMIDYRESASSLRSPDAPKTKAAA